MTICLLLNTSVSVSAKAPAEPYVTKANEQHIFGTFITSPLRQEDKAFMLDCLSHENRFMSIDYTSDKPKFIFGVTPSDVSFLGFETTEINGIETMIANFNKDVEILIFEASENQYLFKERKTSDQIIMTYLIDASYFNGLEEVTIPPLNYDWQQYIPASIQDDDGLKTLETISQSEPSDSSSKPTIDKLAAVQPKPSTVSQMKDYVWVGTGILVGLFALIGIIKLLKKQG